MFRLPYAISPLLRRNAQPAIFIFVALHLTKSCLLQICFQGSIRVDGHTVDNLRPVTYGRASSNIFRKALTQSPNSLARLSRRFWRNFALSFPSRTMGGQSTAAENQPAVLPPAAMPDPNQSCPECRRLCGYSAVPPTTQQTIHPASSRRLPGYDHRSGS